MFAIHVAVVYNISSMLSQFNLAENRVSKDKSSNNEGNLLSEVCKSNNLFILNGRCGNDKGKDAFTFKNISVIDYTVVSAQALKFIENFDITELDCLYSDGHCLLSTDLTFKKMHRNKIDSNGVNEQMQYVPKWNNDKNRNFLIKLTKIKLQKLKFS